MTMIFVDEARIFVKGGDGGKGCESHYRDKFMRYPKPDGGDGGRGGDVVFVADRSFQTLRDFQFRQHHVAARGQNGGSKGKKGKDGQDCLLRVPVGTLIKDHKTGLLIKDLREDRQSVVVAKGGQGGIGNAGRKNLLPPEEGQEYTVDLELKLVADVGIIGFPNAGKSTLISNISKVKSKIARYPFTTKQPILGVVHSEDFCPDATPPLDFIMADLPGLVEGAHQGKGLGDRFLRHAERTKILLHLIDMAGTDGRDPLDDYEKINHELEAYSDDFFIKHKIVVANKMDLPPAPEYLKRFRETYKQDIIPISSLEKRGFEKLVSVIREFLCQEGSPDQ